MSHIVEIQTEVRDPVAIRFACERLQLPPPTEGTFKLFTSHATGWGVELPKWRYPVVCDTASGQVMLDNFSGRWGEQVHLDRFLQIYAVEKAKFEARNRGHTTLEQELADGSIKVTVSIGGTA